MNTLLAALLVAATAFGTQGYTSEIPWPDVPDNLKPPAGEGVILVGHATGVQIYVCQPGTNPPFAWTFKAPEAVLRDSSGKQIIHHFAGPTWKHNDGSEVVGKVAATQHAPKPDAIPWLLLTARSRAGQGVLSRVTSIQRVHTKGGVAPDANTCDKSANGKESRRPYQADYYFYEPKH